MWKPVTKVDLFTFSDASHSGWGGYVVSLNDDILARGDWAPEDRGSLTCSTFRELKACMLVFKSCISEIKGKCILHRSDNKSTVRIMQVGSCKPHLKILALEIYKLAVKNNIILLSEWIPRGQNEQADYLSKITDFEDYMLNPEVFASLHKYWGPFSHDRFASYLTFQINKF